MSPDAPTPDVPSPDAASPEVRTPEVAPPATAAPDAGAPAAAPSGQYSLEELAAVTGVPPRTIRHYQSEKLLSPPQREGRSARYDDGHRDRLVLIGRLQDRGLSLKAIRDLFKRVDKGKVDLEEWLGIGAHLDGRWALDEPELLSDADLAERLDGQRPGLRAALLQHGFVTANDTQPPTYLIASPRLLELVLELDEAGVDVATSAGAVARLSAHLRRAADDLADHVVDRAGRGVGRGPDDVTAALDALPAATVEIVRLRFTAEMERALRARSAELGSELGKRRAEWDAP